MVAPLVANQLKRSGSRRPGGVSFGLPDMPSDAGIPADLDLKALARRLVPLVTPLVEKRIKKRPATPKKPGGVSFGLPVADPEPAGVEFVAGIGPALAARLAEVGIRNLRALAFLDVVDLAVILGISKTRAGDFIAQAKELEGV